MKIIPDSQRHRLARIQCKDCGRMYGQYRPESDRRPRRLSCPECRSDLMVELHP